MFRVLAPIRPVGMNDDMASDWSAVIIADTHHLTDGEFEAGCALARRKCSDHRSVLVQILNGADEERKRVKPDPFLTDWYRSLAEYKAGYPQIGHSSGAQRLGQIKLRGPE